MDICGLGRQHKTKIEKSGALSDLIYHLKMIFFYHETVENNACSRLASSQCKTLCVGCMPQLSIYKFKAHKLRAKSVSILNGAVCSKMVITGGLSTLLVYMKIAKAFFGLGRAYLHTDEGGRTGDNWKQLQVRMRFATSWIAHLLRHSLLISIQR